MDSRTLEAPPASLVDPRTGLPAFGSYRGALPPIDLSPLKRSALYHLTHRKRWLYAALCTDEIFVGLAVVDLGYILNSFAFVYARGDRRLVADCTALAPPGIGGGVSRSFCDGFSARFGGTPFAAKVRMSRAAGGRTVEIDAHHPGLTIRASFDAEAAHPALSAIGAIPGGVVNATEKGALLPLRGEIIADGKRRSLDGGVAGYDFTHGYLARHTQWRWAYALGKAKTGERIAFNLVEGFLGAKECGAWILPPEGSGDAASLIPLGEGRFTLDSRHPLDPWRISTTCGALDLVFRPGGAHSEEKDFGIIRSRFLHPVGMYSGTLRAGGKTLELSEVLGVAEDQDVLW